MKKNFIVYMLLGFLISFFFVLYLILFFYSPFFPGGQVSLFEAEIFVDVVSRQLEKKLGLKFLFLSLR